MSRRFRRVLFVLAVCLAALGATSVPFASVTVPTAHATQTPTTFSGQATVISSSILGSTLSPLLPCNPPAAGRWCIVDTGPVAAGGDSLNESLLCYPTGADCVLGLPDLTQGMVGARVLNATVVAHGNKSHATASVARLGVDLNPAGVPLALGAEFIRADAEAKCTNGAASVSGSVELAEVNGQQILTVNNVQYTIPADTPNYTVPVPLVGVTIVVNEQPASNGTGGGSGQIDVTAIHVYTPLGDLAIGHVHADIACGQLLGCPGPHAFVTGGGFFNNVVANEPKAHFTVAGRNGQQWGHVMYKPTGLHVKKPWAIVYATKADLTAALAGTPFTLDTSTLAGSFEGAAIVYWTDDGTQNGTAIGEALAVDMGEPGRNDYFELAALDAGGTTLGSLGGGRLDGGNIQMHGKC